MTKVYGTGKFDFKRHRVAEYPLDNIAAQQIAVEKAPDSFPFSNAPNSITLTEIQRDRLTKIATANWLKSAGSEAAEGPPFKPELVKEIYDSELRVKGGRKTAPLQRVMILEVSQYLENYLWPNFDPENSSYEHVMSMILMINEKFRENVAAWVCFHDRKDVFKAFLQRVLQLKDQGVRFSIAEKTNYLVFMINAFQMDQMFAATAISEMLPNQLIWWSMVTESTRFPMSHLPD